MASGNWKRQRNVGSIPIFEQKYYIFCEGKKTEPNYFEGIKNRIEKKGIYKNSVFVKIQGVGEGTLKIVEYAKKYIEKNHINEGEIWIVYDKDEFKEEDFNAVAIQVDKFNQNSKKIHYNVAWSNQCIEYWFILYFDYYVSDNDRSFYIDYLNKKFKSFGIGEYKKNDKEIFEKLEAYGDSEKAIRFAEKRLKELKGLPDSKVVPATKVHMLYNQLKRYL